MEEPNNNIPTPQEAPPPAAPVQPPPQSVAHLLAPPPPPAVPISPIQPALPHKAADTVLAGIALVSAFLFWRWGAWGGLTGLAATYGLFFASVTAFAGRRAVRALRWDILLSGVTALALAVSFAIYDDPMFHMLQLCVIIFLTAWYLCGLYGRTRYDSNGLSALLDIAALLITWPFKYISVSSRTLFKGREGRKSQLKLVLIGLAAAVPVLLAAGALLANADAAFEAAMRRFADTIGVSLVQALLAVVLFFPLFSLLFGLARGSELPESKPAESKGGKMEPVIAASFLGAISLLYLCYLLTQLAYFSGGFTGLLPQGYSAAQYARRGFFELCAVAAINLGILLLVSGVTRKGDNASEGGIKKLPLPVRALSAFVCVFTLALIATAESKMALYVRLFGMTRMRLMVSLFILLLAFSFVLLLVQLFRGRFATMKALLAAGCVLVLAMSFADIDRVVLKYNVWAYRSGHLETLDVSAFNELGAAKIPYLIELSYSEDEKIRTDALDQLWNWRTYRTDSPGSLTGYNVTQRRAWRALSEYLAKEDCLLRDYEPTYIEMC
ncbi:MAG: DUF4173 domain-containing protein [Firmicutes bacterium]|nr:DUF4173 domain-containing protein [Bacillota bacterium]